MYWLPAPGQNALLELLVEGGINHFEDALM